MAGKGGGAGSDGAGGMDMSALMSMLGKGGGMGGMGGMGDMMGGMGGGKGGGKGQDDDAEKEGGDGKWNWSQKDEAVHVRFAIEPPATGKKDVNVKFKATSLLVSVRGETVIDSKLGGKVEVDECTWCFSPDKAELQVMLTKVEGKTEKWNSLLAE